MPLDQNILTDRLNAWQTAMSNHTLPRWEDFPQLPLYMDQVVMLLNQYLTPAPECAQGDHALTPAMVNNYVKLKVIPPPVKKRYTRIHLAYLMMVCTFKQTLNISAIPQFLPSSLSEEAVHEAYNDFVDVYHHVCSLCVSHISAFSDSLKEKETDVCPQLVTHFSIAANLFSQLTAQLAAPVQAVQNKEP